MASAGANVNHIEHVSTQLPYALSVAAVSFVCYLIAGFVHSWLLCLVIGAVCIVGALVYLRKRQAKTAA
jgi:Na+/H+ antiporter NhaC